MSDSIFAVDGRVVQAENLVTENLGDQQVAEKFLADLRKYAARGTELDYLVNCNALKDPVDARAWQRGFFARLQKFCQAAVDLLALSGPTGLAFSEAPRFLEESQDDETIRVRRQYGLAWSPSRDLLLTALLRATGTATHLVPRTLRSRRLPG